MSAVLCVVLSAGCEEPLGFLGVDKVERAPESGPRESIENTVESRFALAMHSMASRIRDEGAAFAQAEMARLNAAEGVYRETVQRHESDASGAHAPSSVVVKLYRNYTAGEIAELLGPASESGELRLQIRFDYDLLSTRPRDTDDTGSAEAARADGKFSLLRHGSLVQEYAYRLGSDFDSMPLPPIPSRPKYFVELEVQGNATKQELLAP